MQGTLRRNWALPMENDSTGHRRTRDEPTTKTATPMTTCDQEYEDFERKIGAFSLSSQKRRHHATQKKEDPPKSEGLL